MLYYTITRSDKQTSYTAHAICADRIPKLLDDYIRSYKHGLFIVYRHIIMCNVIIMSFRNGRRRGPLHHDHII